MSQCYLKVHGSPTTTKKKLTMSEFVAVLSKSAWFSYRLEVWMEFLLLRRSAI